MHYFHVHHGQTELDRNGEELLDKHVAWREATVIAGQIRRNRWRPASLG